MAPKNGTPVRPLAPVCDPEYVYTVTNSVANTYDVHFNTSVDNSTGSTVKFTVKADESGTTTYGLSVAVEAEVSAGIFAKIKGTINGSVQKSMTTTYGSTVEVTVNPRSTLNVQYGVWRENVAWSSYYLRSSCSKTQQKSGTAWAPYQKKWRIFYA